MSEQKRVIVLEELAAEALELLRGEGFEVELGAGWDDEELLEEVPGCHALIAGPSRTVTTEILRAGMDLRVVGFTGSSVAGIDVDEATRRGIVVACTPQSNLISGAERALALVLSCAGGLASLNAGLRAGRWETDDWTRAGVEVRGRVLGIVGLGPVGALLAESALALGMTVLACDPSGPVERAPEIAAEVVGDPARVYTAADFIVVDAVEEARAAGLIGDAELAQMKDGVRIISLAKRGVVDRAAWARAVLSGKAAASAAVVYPDELLDDDPLAAHDGVLFTPYLEEPTIDARLRAGIAVAEQLAAVLRGELASAAVNVPLAVVDDAAELMPYLGLCTALGRIVVGLAGGLVHAVEISYGGSFAYFDTQILTLGVLGGVLAGQVEGRVNYVNVQSIAAERGVAAHETKQSDLPDFPRLITVSASGLAGEVAVSGTSLGREHKPRLVRVFGEDIDIDPASHMLFLRYRDAPGIGGAVGTMLGEWGINIRHMSVGRGTIEPEAVMALTLDEPLDAGQLDLLVERCGLAFGRGVEL